MANKNFNKAENDTNYSMLLDLLQEQHANMVNRGLSEDARIYGNTMIDWIKSFKTLGLITVSNKEQ